MNPRTDFWTFSNSLWRYESVKAAALSLQDEQGFDVNLAFWCVWLAMNGRAPGRALEPAAMFSKAWAKDVTGPLRRARRALKMPPDGLDPKACAALRRQAMEAELDAERLQQEYLEALAKDAVPAGASSRKVATLSLAAAAEAQRMEGDFAAFLDAVFRVAESV